MTGMSDERDDRAAETAPPPVAWAVWERGGDLLGYVSSEEDAREAVQLAEHADRVNDSLEPKGRYEITPVRPNRPNQLHGTQVWEFDDRAPTEDELRLRAALEAHRAAGPVEAVLEAAFPGATASSPDTGDDADLEVRVINNEAVQAQIAYARQHPEERLERDVARRRVWAAAPPAEDEPEVDVTITLHDMRPREARLLRAAVDAMRGTMLSGHDDLLVGLVALACWLDGPDPTRPGQTFAQQVQQAIPAEAWNQWLPIEAQFRTGLLERSMRATEDDPFAELRDEIRSRPRWSEADADGNVTVHKRDEPDAD